MGFAIYVGHYALCKNSTNFLLLFISVSLSLLVAINTISIKVGMVLLNKSSWEDSSITTQTLALAPNRIRVSNIKL